MHRGARTFAGSTVVVTLLAAEVAHEEALRTLGVALPAGQLPTHGAGDALVSTRTRARLAAQVTLGADADVTVVPAHNHHLTVQDTSRLSIISNL